VSLDYTAKAVEELLLLSSKCIEHSDPELNDPHSSPFYELKTEYQQTKFFNENFGLVVSAWAYFDYAYISFFS